MQNIKTMTGLVALGVIVGWAGPKLVSAISSDAVVIEQSLMAQKTAPEVTHNQTPDLTSGLALTAPKPVLPEDQAAADRALLTPEQTAAIEMLESSARALNQTGETQETQDLRFDHLAVDGLNVRHFYTVNYPYTALDRAAFIESQEVTINQALCGNAGLRGLIRELGLTYSYNYLSQDDRLLGNVTLDPAGCTG
ncbi:hypothetical protein [Algirhabdus cladophorae]|uniref:hypothetical protein n=1 Tax=Algirhabdus cladophorae TaxID=3377108 RepID=UPI003B84B66A